MDEFTRTYEPISCTTVLIIMTLSCDVGILMYVADMEDERERWDISRPSVSICQNYSRVLSCKRNPERILQQGASEASDGLDVRRIPEDLVLHGLAAMRGGMTSPPNCPGRENIQTHCFFPVSCKQANHLEK